MSSLGNANASGNGGIVAPFLPGYPYKLDNTSFQNHIDDATSLVEVIVKTLCALNVYFSVNETECHFVCTWYDPKKYYRLTFSVQIWADARRHVVELHRSYGDRFAWGDLYEQFCQVANMNPSYAQRPNLRYHQYNSFMNYPLNSTTVESLLALLDTGYVEHVLTALQRFATWSREDPHFPHDLLHNVMPHMMSGNEDVRRCAVAIFANVFSTSDSLVSSAVLSRAINNITMCFPRLRQQTKRHAVVALAGAVVALKGVAAVSED